jgi:hypothetical protein
LKPFQYIFEPIPEIPGLAFDTSEDESMDDERVVGEKNHPLDVAKMELEVIKKPSLILRRKSMQSIHSEKNDEIEIDKEELLEVPDIVMGTTEVIQTQKSTGNMSESSSSTVKVSQRSPVAETPTLPTLPFFPKKQTRFAENTRHSMSLPPTSDEHHIQFSTRERKGKSFDVSVTAVGSIGSYDSAGSNLKIKSHHGLIDQRALTTMDPEDLMELIINTLKEFEMKFTNSNEAFKLVVETPVKDSRSVESHKKGIFGNIIQKFRYISLFGLKYNRGFDGQDFTDSIDLKGIDSYVKFNIMIHRINNLKGLYIIDLKRVKGDIWQFKKLYHAFILKLDLQNA